MNVIDYIAKHKLVEKLTKTYNKQTDRNIDDFVQEIYLILALQADKLEDFENQPVNNLRNYLITIIRNQYYSNTSAYYRKYTRHDDRFKQLDFEYDVDENNNIIYDNYDND